MVIDKAREHRADTAPTPLWTPQTYRLPFQAGPWVWRGPSWPIRVTRLLQPAPLSALPSPQACGLHRGTVGVLLFAHRLTGPWPRYQRSGDWLVYVQAQAPQYVVDAQLGVDAYVAQFSSKSRYNLRRLTKQYTAANGGQAELTLARTPDDIRAFHAECIPLARKTYQHRLLRHSLPDDEAFVQRMVACAERGDAWGFVLRLHGQPIAFSYFEGEGPVLSWDYPGYDPEWAHLSPGTVLMWLALQQIQAEPRYLFVDFGHGESQQKAVFATDRPWMANILVVPNTLKHRLWIGFHRAWSATTLVARDAAVRLGLLQWVKKRLKSSVAAPASAPDR